MTEQHLGASRIAGPDACRRVLLVGELNPYGADPDYALYYEPPNSAGGRLQRVVLGLPARQWYLPIWRVNLCAGSFDREAAAARVADLLCEAPWRTIILLGKQVKRAFGLPAQPRTLVERDFWHTVTTIGPTRRIIGIPHPSGRNPLWGDRANVERARLLLREVSPEIPWGSLDEEKSA